MLRFAQLVTAVALARAADLAERAASSLACRALGTEAHCSDGDIWYLLSHPNPGPEDDPCDFYLVSESGISDALTDAERERRRCAAAGGDHA